MGEGRGEPAQSLLSTRRALCVCQDSLNVCQEHIICVSNVKCPIGSIYNDCTAGWRTARRTGVGSGILSALANAKQRGDRREPADLGLVV